MDQRNFFFEREAGQQIFDARPDGLGGVQINQAFLRASVAGACRHDRGGNQRHGAMFDFGHKTHNVLLIQIFVKSIGHEPPRAISPALSPVR
jgi:hypothetical protein